MDDIQSYLGSDRIDAAKIVSSSEESRNEAEHMVKTRDVETVNSAKIYKKRRASFKRKACQREKFASRKQKKRVSLIVALVVISALSFITCFLGLELLSLKDLVQTQHVSNQVLVAELTDLREQRRVILEVAPSGEGYEKLIGIFLVCAAVALAVYLTISGPAPSADIADSVVDVARVLTFQDEGICLDWNIHLVNDEVVDVYVKGRLKSGMGVKGSEYIKNIHHRLDDADY